MKDNVNINLFAPHPALQPYVQHYCYMGAGAIDDNLTTLSMYPVDSTQMSFVLDEYHQFRETGGEEISTYPLCFVGLIDQGRVFDRFPKKFVQVIFKSYGAFKFFKIPQRYLVNQGTDMRLLFPETTSLTEQLRALAHSPFKVIELLEAWLLKRLLLTEKTDVDRIGNACEMIQKSRGVIRIEELSRSIGMSTTTLGDQFREKVGFGPKTFSRIVRFNHINSFIGRQQHTDWQELVYTYGFFDQNHFIKEFKRFYGCTPSEWHSSQFFNPIT